MSSAESTPLLMFDGGCVFCRHFAELSELRSGIPGLRIRDGRAEGDLRASLERRGYRLRDGAVLLDGERVLHGAEAIQWLCARMTPTAALLRLLAPLLATPARARALYPLLLLARRAALAARGLPLDPGETEANRSDPPAGDRREAPDSIHWTGRSEVQRHDDAQDSLQGSERNCCIQATHNRDVLALKKGRSAP